MDDFSQGLALGMFCPNPLKSPKMLPTAQNGCLKFYPNLARMLAKEGLKQKPLGFWFESGATDLV